ncbi:response regulator transcription factor [Paenibacillus pabuli]|uniref:response regulator transcription factor n=1 Tax=Paenibacillus pabuli TaxID=1472 RepID=UPI000780ED28|nr:response regulator [Paenibacillus pabuli]MEC0127895.1 response regulator [Paenibacillus pabuli]
MTMTYRTIIVEDEALIRRNVSRKFSELSTRFEVVGEARNGEEALQLMEHMVPDLVVTDIQMPVMNGLELAKHLYFAYPHVKIVILSGHHEFEYARQAIRYNVEDYLLKPLTKEQLRTLLDAMELRLGSAEDSLAHVRAVLDEQVKPEDIAEAVKRYLKQNYMHEITLQDMAGQMHFSVDYLGKCFKKVTGETPLKYMTGLRINEAKRMLVTREDMDIKIVGKAVGYSDSHYFSRIFKNKTGLYPSEYRQQSQQRKKALSLDHEDQDGLG